METILLIEDLSPQWGLSDELLYIKTRICNWLWFRAKKYIFIYPVLVLNLERREMPLDQKSHLVTWSERDCKSKRQKSAHVGLLLSVAMNCIILPSTMISSITTKCKLKWPNVNAKLALCCNDIFYYLNGLPLVAHIDASFRSNPKFLFY